MLATVAIVQAGTLAPVTNTTFFDVEIDGRVVGQIQLGLYGETVPKTVRNFVEICKGGHYVPKRQNRRGSRSNGGSGFLGQVNFYFTELFKVNPLDFFRDPIDVFMRLVAKFLEGPPQAAIPE